MNDQLILFGLRLAFVSLATFLSILVWSKTRDSAWMLIVIGIIVSYADILFSILELFGLASIRTSFFGSFPFAQAVLQNLPMLFFSAGFIVIIKRHSGKF